MNQISQNAAAKIHPATREALPDDPLEMHAIEVRGDADLMLRLLVEEYTRIGGTVADIMQLARDPNYQGFHGLWRLHGEEGFRRRVRDIVARCGVLRVRTVEKPLEPDCPELVQIQLPACS